MTFKFETSIFKMSGLSTIVIFILLNLIASIQTTSSMRTDDTRGKSDPLTRDQHSTGPDTGGKSDPLTKDQHSTGPDIEGKSDPLNRGQHFTEIDIWGTSDPDNGGQHSTGSEIDPRQDYDKLIVENMVTEFQSDDGFRLHNSDIDHSLTDPNFDIYSTRILYKSPNNQQDVRERPTQSLSYNPDVRESPNSEQDVRESPVESREGFESYIPSRKGRGRLRRWAVESEEDQLTVDGDESGVVSSLEASWAGPGESWAGPGQNWAGTTENWAGSGSVGSCEECESIREMKRSYRTTMLKDEILRKLRLTGPPNVTGQVRPNIPHIDRLIAQLSEEEEEQGGGRHETRGEGDDHATPMGFIMFSQPASPEVSVNDSTVCWFPLQQEIFHHQIINATLGIYIRAPLQPYPPQPFHTYLLIHSLGPRDPGAGEPGSRRRVQIRRLRLGGVDGGMEGKWVEVDFRGVLSRLVSRREGVYGIQIEGWDQRGRQVAVVIPQSDAESLYRPYLEIHVKETISSRPKRSPERLCEEAGAERSCCRYPLLVDFREFGWDFVIVPRSYSAYYCSGECPYLFMQTHSHSRLTQDARRDGGGPCCTPRKVSPISMIYYDNRMNIVYSKLPGMVVDTCGCS